MSRQFAVVGLGRLGKGMMETLVSLGHEVLGVDLEERVVQAVANDLPGAHVVAADATDEGVLSGLNVESFDAAAVVIGENGVEAGILATSNLKELGVPFVVARATSPVHARVLHRVGADRVLQPEEEMGQQLARTIASPAILDYVDLGDDEALVEAQVPDAWAGRSLVDLALPRTTGLTVLALKPKGGPGTIPRGDDILRKGDVVVIGGPKKNLDRLDLLR